MGYTWVTYGLHMCYIWVILVYGLYIYDIYIYGLYMDYIWRVWVIVQSLTNWGAHPSMVGS